MSITPVPGSSHPASASSQTPCLVDLDHLGICAIEGPDAVRFLQGQITCDLRELPPANSRAGAHCNPKGRMLSTFRVLQTGPETLLLRSFTNQLPAIQTDLGKYIVFSKAKLIDKQAQYRIFGLIGPEAGVLIQQLAGNLPTEDNQWLVCRNIIFIRLDAQRFECWVPLEEQHTFQQQLAPLTTPASADLWTLAAIRAGFGEVYPETREMFTPQALNYQLVNAISFRKGCYTGQEIVARLHYKATLKRHMYRVTFSSSDKFIPPAPGGDIVDQAGKRLGELVVAVAIDGSGEALVSVPDDQLDNLYFSGYPELKLTVGDLPYALHPENG